MAVGRGRDVEDFAAFVRGLKERSERSYGALARRLNVSASTLHRYCSGEALPADYALLERFAKLCGASPEERVELHQLWVAATASRGGGASRESGAATPAPGPVAAPASASPSPAAPAAKPTPAPAPPPRPAAQPAAAGAPRRRRWLVAAAVAGAVAVVVVAVAGLLLPDGESDRNAARNPARQPAPLTWTVDSHVWQANCDHRYLIDDPPGEVPPPPVQQDAEAWAESTGARHGGETMVRITVQGRDAATVVLHALRVRVVGRDAPPASGGVFFMSNGCGGALTPRQFDVNLDADRPVARSRAGNDEGVEIPAVTFPYRVSADEPEILLVNGHTERCDCRWYLELEWSSQGRSGTVRIDDAGRPFRTSGVEGLTEYGFDTETGSWAPAVL